MSSVDDFKLVKKAQSGDYKAFEELVNRYESKVYTVAYRFFGNHEDACDLTQEVSIKIYKSLKNFRGDSNFMTWVYHITANACRDELRKRKNKKVVSLDEEFKDDMTLLASIPDSALLPDDEIERKELCEQVQRCLNMMSDEYRLILIMREIQGLSYDEIASTMECSLGTVKSRLNRARASFRKKFSALVEPKSNLSRQNK
ncbi:sigma-70 family RNA polymerase sigma factor [Peptococcaceae bacterium]|nr:sigma-70 family RNA polymerase sigma factor [Peptococcaceae bacterium]